MKNFKLFSVLLSVLFFTNTSTVAANELLGNGSAQNQEWRTYDCYEFSFSYPKTYTSVKPYSDSDVTLITQLQSDSDSFMENILITKLGVMTKDEVIEEFKKSDMADLKHENILVNGLEGVSLSYTMKYQNIEVIHFQYVIFGKKYTYSLSLSSQKEEYEKYKEEAIKIFNSFKTNPNVKVEDGWDIFSNERVFFVYPSGYQKVVEEEADPEEVVTLQEVSDNEDDLVEEQFYLTATALAEDVQQLEELNELNKGLVSGFKENFKIESNEVDAAKKTLKVFMRLKKDKNVIACVQVYLKNQTMYMLTFSGEKNRYEQGYKKMVDKAFNSFRILSPGK